MSIHNINTIERIISHHKSDIGALSIPSLSSFSTSTPSHVAASPFISKFKLDQIRIDLVSLRQILVTQLKSHKNYKEALANVDNVINDLDEKSYVNGKLIEQYQMQFELENASTTGSNVPEDSIDLNDDNANTVAEDSDLTNLRKRLLSGGQQTQHLDSSGASTDKLNDYHETMQENILSDLTELTSSLKNSAIKLSSKILNDDFQILTETNENIIKNSSMFKLIDRNLNNYLENKSGGRISLFFLIKATAALVVVFLVMVLLVKIIPKFG